MFLPSECPLLNHILLSYQKHHDQAQYTIPEDQEYSDALEVIRPLKGIQSSKYTPLIRSYADYDVKPRVEAWPIEPMERSLERWETRQNVESREVPVRKQSIIPDPIELDSEEVKVSTFNVGEEEPLEASPE